MTAVRFQIIQRVTQDLVDAAIADEVELNPSGDPSRFRALHIFDEGDDAEIGEAGTDRRALNVGIDGYVEGGDGPAALADLNDLYCRVIETLFVEPVLSELATEIEQGALQVTTATRASKRRMAFSLTLTIHYATRRGSPQIID